MEKSYPNVAFPKMGRVLGPRTDRAVCPGRPAALSWRLAMLEKLLAPSSSSPAALRNRAEVPDPPRSSGAARLMSRPQARPAAVAAYMGRTHSELLSPLPSPPGPLWQVPTSTVHSLAPVVLEVLEWRMTSSTSPLSSSRAVLPVQPGNRHCGGVQTQARTPRSGVGLGPRALGSTQPPSIPPSRIEYSSSGRWLGFLGRAGRG